MDELGLVKLSSYTELLRKGTRAYACFYPTQNLISVFTQSSKKVAKMLFQGTEKYGENRIFNHTVIPSHDSVRKRDTPRGLARAVAYKSVPRPFSSRPNAEPILDTWVRPGAPQSTCRSGDGGSAPQPEVLRN